MEVKKEKKWETIAVTIEEEIAILTLNRPREFNALNRRMFRELWQALTGVAGDERARVVVLTGARKAFCLGIDLEEASSWGAETWREFLPLFQEIIITLATMPKPTIAAINGFATGAGLDLALACDLRIASEGAKLAEAFIRQGLVPDGGGTFFLPRSVGLAKAAELIFTGEAITAQEAERIGLINKVVPAKDLSLEVHKWARGLIQRSKLALALAKRNLYQELSLDLRKALKLEADAQKECLASNGFQKGLLTYQKRRR